MYASTELQHALYHTLGVKQYFRVFVAYYQAKYELESIIEASLCITLPTKKICCEIFC